MFVFCSSYQLYSIVVDCSKPKPRSTDYRSIMACVLFSRNLCLQKLICTFLYYLYLLELDKIWIIWKTISYLLILIYFILQRMESLNPNLYCSSFWTYINSVVFLWILVNFTGLKQSVLKLATVTVTTSCILQLDQRWRIE